MQLSIYLVLLIAGLLGTFIVFRLALTRSTESAVNFVLVLSASTMVILGVVAMSSFEIVTVLDDGTEVQHSYPALAVLAVVGAAANGFALFKAGVETLS